MELLGWLLIAPVAALVAVLAGALLLLGVYALAVVGLAAVLVAVHGSAGSGGRRVHPHPALRTHLTARPR